jgi:hypothetical protein
MSSLDTINKLYANLTYVDKYNGSIFIVILITLILFLCCAYLSIYTNIQPIKDDWQNQRCNPKVMPFAGFINKPEDETITDFTQKNFTYCSQDILKTIMSETIKPITFITTMLQSFYEELFQALQSVRTLFASVRSKTESIAREVLGRVLNVTVPLRVLLLTLIDSLSKVQGILTAALYTSLGSYLTFQSLMGNMVNAIIITLIAMVGIIFGLWLMPFTWPMAISGTAIFVALSIPLAIVLNFLTSVLGVHSEMSIPGLKARPKLCFDKDTLIPLCNGSKVAISSLSPGDRLCGRNEFVNATIKLLKEGNESMSMYQLHGVTVSDCHQVKYAGKWISVYEHPNSVKLDDYTEKYIYCLSLTSKRLTINETVFQDWDELLDHDILRIYGTILSMTSKSLLNDLVHRYGNGGFAPDTLVRMNNGQYVEIHSICPGDVLFNGTKVYGTVMIDGLRNEQYIYNEEEAATFVGGSNICIFNEECKKIESTFLQSVDRCRRIGIPIEKCEKLYHLLTDVKYFYITKHNLAICDYNYTMEIL